MIIDSSKVDSSMAGSNAKGLPFRLPRMLTYEYEALVSPDRLLSLVVDVAKRPSRLGGTTREADAVILCDLKTGESARFISAGKLLRIQFEEGLRNMVNAMCHRLTGAKAIKTKALQGKNVVKPVKPHTPAREILARHLATEAYQKHVLVLPEALKGADESVFRRDGALDRYLTNLPRFAEAAFNPANAKVRLGKLAEGVALTHFVETISQTAEREHREDYVAVYKGVERVFPMHVTIGSGLNATECMSIHFALDYDIQKLVIARFGPHGGGAKS